MTVKLIYTLSFPQYIKLLYCYMRDLGWRLPCLLSYLWIHPGWEVILGCLLQWSPKSYSLETFDWLVHLVECLNVSTTITEGVILCIIITDVNKFIGHCLSPLDSWNFRLLLRPLFFSSLRQLALKKIEGSRTVIIVCAMCVCVYKNINTTKSLQKAIW